MKKLLTIAALTASTFTAQAEVRINGFANLIGGITSSDDTVYGYEDKISFSEESSFAIQITGDINEKMTATGQILARGEDDYEAKFAWAYMTYEATDNLSISAGRLRLPLFKYSSSLDVGYSYHWVSAPRAVYDVLFNNIDGIRLDYSDYVGDWEYNAQLVVGKINNEEGSLKIEANNTAVFSVEAVNDWFKARVVYGTAKVTLENETIDQSLSVLNDLGLTELYNNLAYKNDTTPFLGLGLEVDKFDWFIGGEITILDAEESFNPKADAYYVTAGLRMGKFTPSITYENFEAKEYKYLDQVDALPLPAANKAGIEGLVRAVEESAFNKHNVITLGLRYDFDTNVAFKTDLSRYDNKLDDAETTLLRVAVNYVF